MGGEMVAQGEAGSSGGVRQGGSAGRAGERVQCEGATKCRGGICGGVGGRVGSAHALSPLSPLLGAGAAAPVAAARASATVTPFLQVSS